MHRMWDIREVAETVFESLRSDTDLRSVVRTCRSFYAIGTPCLWKYAGADQVYHLMKCIIINPIVPASTAKRWERFQLFSSAIRRLHFTPDSLPEAESESFAMLCQAASIKAPFRRLIDLHATLSQPPDLQWLLCMMHAPIRSLHIGFKPGSFSTDAVRVATRSLIHALPQTLTDLVVQRVVSVGESDEELWPENSELPPLMESYQASFPTSLERLCGLTYLRHLTLTLAPDDQITSSGFAALRILTVASDLGPISALLLHVNGPLEAFLFTEMKTHPNHLATGDMCRAIPRFSETLRVITLNLWGRSQTHVVVPMEDFLPLTACPGISSFKLAFYDSNIFPDSNSFIKQITRPWQKLKTFRFMFSHEDSPVGSYPSAPALISLAVHCPDLEDVILSYLDVSEEQPTPPCGLSSQRIYIAINGARIGERLNPTLWATFICLLWPKVDLQVGIDPHGDEQARDWSKRIREVVQAIECTGRLRADPKLLEDHRGQPLSDTIEVADEAASG